MKTTKAFTNIVAISFLILLFLFAFTWIMFDFNKSDNSLKDSLSIVSSMLGGIATIVATYVAIVIYNGWKVEYNKNLEKEFIIKILGALEDCHFDFIGKIHPMKTIVEALKAGMQYITEVSPLEIDKNHIEKISHNVGSISKLNFDQNLSREFLAYREIYESLFSLTRFYSEVYIKDLANYKEMGTTDFSSFFFIKNDFDNPDSFLNKVEKYQNNYETLNNRLLELIKA